MYFLVVKVKGMGLQEIVNIYFGFTLTAVGAILAFIYRDEHILVIKVAVVGASQIYLAQILKTNTIHVSFSRQPVDIFRSAFN
jgi:hypothetical protein